MMFTWIGFVGKVFGFLGEKLADQKFERLGDKKASACEAFMRMYVAIAELEGLSSQILHDAKETLKEQDPLWLFQAVRILQSDIEANTKALTDAAIQLGPVLDVFNPTLHSCLMSVCACKFNILFDASKSFFIESQEGQSGFGKLRFKNPKDRILELDMEEHYRWLLANPNHAEWKNLEWPQTLLINNKIEDAFEDSEIDLDASGLEAVGDLVKKLEPHMEQLSNARKKIRRLICNSFSLEDVLYVSSKIDKASTWFPG